MVKKGNKIRFSYNNIQYTLYTIWFLSNDNPPLKMQYEAMSSLDVFDATPPCGEYLFLVSRLIPLTI